MSLPSRILAAALACALTAQAQTLPDLGDVSAASLSESQERTIGNRIMREVRIDPAYVDDPEIADYIKSLGERLLSVSDSPRRDITFFVVNDEQVNAFAMVGGHIGVNAGLILLTQDESELAGVVAHEIAHVLQRHQARMVHGQSRSQWTSLAALALALIASRSSGSQSGQITEAALASAGALSIQNQLDYTREHEREADRVGLTLLDRAGFSPRGMAGFFERLLRTNRLNEYKGAPSYLRTHPLTTERIADIQDRLQSMPSRLIADTFDYRLARAKLRALAGSPNEAVRYFRTVLEDKTVVRPREEVYGLAFALRRARDFEAARATLDPVRKAGPPQPAFELLAAQIEAEAGKLDDSLAIYRAALKATPSHRGLLNAYLAQLLQMGRPREVLAELDPRLRTSQEDPALYEVQARAYEAVGQRSAQHRAQAEAYVRRGNLAAAVDQLELATKARSGDFYEQSIVESRLRELRAQLENERAAEKALKIS